MNLSELNETVLLLIFFGSGALGIIGHYIKKAKRKQTGSTFAEYMLNNKRYTLSACGSTFVSLVGSLAVGVNLTEISTMAGAFMAGFMFDSLMNKDK